MEIIKNEFWIIKSFGLKYFTATATKENNLCYPEHRIYYSKFALEKDFGKINTES